MQFRYAGNFRYSGCGDPANTKFEWSLDNLLPVVPVSNDYNLRQRQCAKAGCIETVLGCKEKHNPNIKMIMNHHKFYLLST